MTTVSYAHQILRLFQLYGPMFQSESTKMHGSMGLEIHRVRAEYTKLINKGHLQDDSGRLSITRPGERSLENEAVKQRANDAPLTPPRLQPDFRPLQKKNIPSVLGMRPGSNEYRNWPSVHAPFKK